MIGIPPKVRPWLFRAWMAMMLIAMLVALGTGLNR